MPTRCLASRISFLTVLDLWPFLWCNRPKISPQELTWVKSVLSYGGDFASGLVGAPKRMMTGANPAAPDWKTTSGGTFKGFTEPELRYDLSIQNSLPPRNPHFWFFCKKGNELLSNLFRPSCMSFFGSQIQKKYFYVTSVTRPTDVRIEPQA